VQTVLCSLVTVYMLVLIVRAIMSWFPVQPGSPFTTIYGLIHDITEPVLGPMRRIIPPAGMFDLSFLVLFILLTVLRRVVCG
jgi:YggT family protein